MKITHSVSSSPATAQSAAVSPSPSPKGPAPALAQKATQAPIPLVPSLQHEIMSHLGLNPHSLSFIIKNFGTYFEQAPHQVDIVSTLYKYTYKLEGVGAESKWWTYADLLDKVMGFPECRKSIERWAREYLENPNALERQTQRLAFGPVARFLLEAEHKKDCNLRNWDLWKAVGNEVRSWDDEMPVAIPLASSDMLFSLSLMCGASKEGERFVDYVDRKLLEHYPDYAARVRVIGLYVDYLYKSRFDKSHGYAGVAGRDLIERNLLQEVKERLKLEKDDLPESEAFKAFLSKEVSGLSERFGPNRWEQEALITYACDFKAALDHIGNNEFRAQLDEIALKAEEKLISSSTSATPPETAASDSSIGFLSFLIGLLEYLRRLITGCCPWLMTNASER